MPPIPLTNPAQPLDQRLRDAFGYPLRGAALASLVGFSLAHVLAVLPVVGALLELIVWAATYLYALACLRHTAEGFRDPPELSSDSATAGWIVVGLMLLGMAATWAVEASAGRDAAWLVSGLMALVLPAIVMALAFDEDWGHALNPLRWLATMARVGAPYFLLVLTQLLIAALLGPAQRLFGSLPALFALPLAGALATYATLFNFHLMGVFLHRLHDRLGLRLEAEALAHAGAQGADEGVLEQARHLQRRGDTLAAITLLGQRLDARSAPASIHLACRALLRERRRHDELLARSARCIDALLAADDETRALAIVTENTAIDPNWLPDSPAITGRLAYAAMHRGMIQLALKLARGYPNHWPRDAMAPHFGLLAAKLLSQLGRGAEAGVLASKLVQAFPDCVERLEIDRFLASIGSDASPS
ncbi:MAG TPA: hypothetical protein VFN09_11845 [Rhodanobacteraceae bacterium]|nr:hypothetical protein [Rhodanobacteraceae bacterium]